jgi:hypothetical protein
LSRLTAGPRISICSIKRATMRSSSDNRVRRPSRNSTDREFRQCVAISSDPL